MRIGLFIPCYIDAFFPEVGIATLELLERFGHDVDYQSPQPGETHLAGDLRLCRWVRSGGRLRGGDRPQVAGAARAARA
jgi:hypothetical protein